MKTLIEAERETEEDGSLDHSSNNLLTPIKNESLNSSRAKRIELLSIERKGKRLKFMINGNRFFRGIRYCLCTERIRSFDVLLEDLNRLIKDVNLPKGVQFIYPVGDKRHRPVCSLDEFKDNHIYVCSSLDHYIELDYTTISQGFDHNGHHINQLSKSTSCTAADQRIKNIASSFASHSTSSSNTSIKADADSLPFIRPKLVNIIINGPKPRELIKLLLNKRSVHSYDQLLTDIQTKSKTLFTPIRRVHNLNGKKVTKLKDFFGDQDIFIVSATDRCNKLDFDIHPEECNNIHFGRFLLGKGVVNVENHSAASKKYETGDNNSKAQIVSTSKEMDSSSSLSSSSSSSVWLENVTLRDLSLENDVFTSENYDPPRSNQRKANNNNNITTITTATTITPVLKTPRLSLGAIRNQNVRTYNRDSDSKNMSPKEKMEKKKDSRNEGNVREDNNNARKASTRHSSLKYSRIPILQGLTQLPRKINSTINSAKVSNKITSTFTSSNSTYSTMSLLFPREICRKYSVGNIIGDGNFAVVHECVNKQSNVKYAMKIINKSKCRGKEVSKSEVAILRKINHPFIIQLIEDYDFVNEMYLVMELVAGGDLFDAITSKNRFSEKEARGMVTNLLQALAYLHSMNICHRDIKPENLLVSSKRDGKMFLKLADFGLAVKVIPGQKLYEVCGTPIYVAPEILAETGYDFKVDVWAAGVIAYILLCGYPPFVSLTNDNDELFDLILKGKFEFIKHYWSTISKEAKDFITKLLVVDQYVRLTSLEALRHHWILEDISVNW